MCLVSPIGRGDQAHESPGEAVMLRCAASLDVVATDTPVAAPCMQSYAAAVTVGCALFHAQLDFSLCGQKHV